LENPDLLLAVIPAMSPLDCSMAAKAMTLMQDSAVTIPPLPKIVSKLPAWDCATSTPNKIPVPSSRAIHVGIDLISDTYIRVYSATPHYCLISVCRPQGESIFGRLTLGLLISKLGRTGI
jgi:hypothetical protein